ncbi:polysaccharide deacetylase family protein [Sorangium sp. So ce131]|uniref:polysaccharide deacetylase family protein n=1 Tax=Sorangium sp. So ce131 TaxID=3133282 RepID=UPI003F5EDF30
MRIPLSFPVIFAAFLACCGGEEENPGTGSTTSGASSSASGSGSGSGTGGGSTTGTGDTTTSAGPGGGGGNGGGDGGNGGGGGGGGGSGGNGGSGGDGGGGSGGDGGSGGNGGSAGSGGDGGGGGDVSPGEPSGLPAPPGRGVPRPSGAPGNLVVLDWAGFRGAASYTFDDSQPSHITHYAALQAEGVPMTFYINSGRNDLPNFDATWTRAAADGHELGNHTAHHCHANMTECAGGSAGTLLAEIDACTDYIVENYGQNVWTMASPFGDGGWVDPARERFFLNRGVNSGMIAPRDSSNAWNLPTEMAVGGESASAFNADLDAALSTGKWVIFLFHTILPTDAHWYADVDLAAITGSMRHGKAQPELWLDTVVNVGAYWVGQKVVSSATRATSGSDTTWTWALPEHFPPGKYVRVRVDGGTLKQGGRALAWDDHGYYEVALDARSLTLSP